MSLWRGGLYAIADVAVLAARGVELRAFAEELRAGGVGVVQLRDKGGSPQRVLAGAAVLREVFAGTGTLLVMNDRADLALLAGFGGVHVGQGDLGVNEARRLVGFAGVSTHTPEEVAEADATDADYVAIGPVFATSTKLDAEPAVGLEGVRRARASTSKPLVGIGGITRRNARSAIAAGADAVAVISGLLVSGQTIRDVSGQAIRDVSGQATRDVVREFSRVLG